MTYASFSGEGSRIIVSDERPRHKLHCVHCRFGIQHPDLNEKNGAP